MGKLADVPWADFVRRIEMEGHGDHTQSVLRYRALQEAVNRQCDVETYRRVMDCYKQIVKDKTP